MQLLCRSSPLAVCKYTEITGKESVRIPGPPVQPKATTETLSRWGGLLE